MRKDIHRGNKQTVWKKEGRFLKISDRNFTRSTSRIDCKTVGFFFSKSVKKSVKRGREPHTPGSVSFQSHSPFSASFQTFCLTARAYLTAQKYGLFWSLPAEQVQKMDQGKRTHQREHTNHQYGRERISTISDMDPSDPEPSRGRGALTE